MDRGYFTLQWHITNRCDQRCKHCYIYGTKKKITLFDVNVKNAENIIDKFIFFCKKIKRKPFINITGGDPLLHPFVWDILKLLSSKNIKFNILGNPYHLDNVTVHNLKKLDCVNYQLSIDGLRKTHDNIRKADSFDITLEKIKILKNNKIKVNIMSTVSKINYHELPEVARLVSTTGVDKYTFARYCPTDNDIEQSIPPFEYKQFLEKMYNVYSELSHCGTKFILKDHLWKLFFYERGEFRTMSDNNTVYDGCGCGINHITLLEDGTVYACRRFISPIGNINDFDFYTIFFGEQLSYYRNIDNLEKCSKCELFNYCRGCHAVSAGVYGDFFKPDPQCWKTIK